LVSVCSRFGCVRCSPGSLAVPRCLLAEGEQEDEHAHPNHKERARSDDEATCRDLARSAHRLSTRPPAAAWRVPTVACRLAIFKPSCVPSCLHSYPSSFFTSIIMIKEQEKETSSYKKELLSPPHVLLTTRQQATVNTRHAAAGGLVDGLCTLLARSRQVALSSDRAHSLWSGCACLSSCSPSA
jgi:hypothetical protein